jgi:uncharacterized membrane protein
MSMDFETVKFMRVLFAVIFAFVGGAGGFRYFGIIGGIVGVLVGALIGWNTVDLLKGRAHK